ncbi:MAG: Rrf2 family transcriptional regulator [Candidatus Rokubacteria bacterium]|nr:Rrf2 family transcriptional regulator [Candidatus Rokubacteria bacterium]
MTLTLKGDYAVRVVVDLAAQPRGATVKSDDLGRRTGVPRAFLTKIIQALAHAGLVRTQRGTRGGIGLLEKPRAITLRQVIEAVEGPIYLNRCLIRAGLCPRDGFCPVHPVWARIQAIVTRELDSVSIKELVDASRKPTLTKRGRRPDAELDAVAS